MNLSPFCAGTAAVLIALAPGNLRAETVVRHLWMMGTRLVIEVESGDRASALSQAEAAVRKLQAAEDRLSTWREESELSQLNRSTSGTEFWASRELAAEISEALACARDTWGAFDPTVGALVMAWGLREGGRVPDEGQLTRARERTGHGLLQIDGQRITRHGETLLEEGAFGKGAGLDRATQALTELGVRRARMDLGGQMMILGEASRIPVAHPDERDRPVVEVLATPGSVATSGNSERGIRVDGDQLGHLLDPRTGRPAGDFGSLTVFTKSALRADCLSTGLYVLGPDAALRWAAGRTGVEVLVLERAKGGLRARASAGLRGHITANEPGLSIEFDQEGENR